MFMGPLSIEFKLDCITPCGILFINQLFSFIFFFYQRITQWILVGFRMTVRFRNDKYFKLY